MITRMEALPSTHRIAAPTAPSGSVWHFSDTRSEQGRVRFVLEGAHAGAAAWLLTEGPGWNAQQRHHDLHDAELALAWLPDLPQELYLQALSDLEQQRRFYNQSAA